MTTKEECEMKGSNYTWIASYRKNNGINVSGYCKRINKISRGRDRKLQMKKGIMNYEGNKYDYSVHHPSAYEDNVYSVNIHRYGENYADRNTYHTQIEAYNSGEALKKAKKKLKEYRWG
jgi:hypothetical protein